MALAARGVRDRGRNLRCATPFELDDLKGAEPRRRPPAEHPVPRRPVDLEVELASARAARRVCPGPAAAERVLGIPGTVAPRDGDQAEGLADPAAAFARPRGEGVASRELRAGVLGGDERQPEAEADQTRSRSGHPSLPIQPRAARTAGDPVRASGRLLAPPA